ncbi:MAG: histone deacetylase family protein [Rhodospirillales bacterium]|jgi:acetoin utilization deacetylase AcuC-like enzyme|nr:histone deacetylase family protein [Rhodospirillales bacterium]
MVTWLFTHPMCIEHDPGPFHPEQPERLRAVVAALEAEEFKGLSRHEAPSAERAQIERVHAPAYVDAVFAAVPESGQVHLDPDTAVSSASGEAALRAAGAVTAAVDAVVTGAAKNAFCAVRPPGHHAEASRAMGFCLFNNVAIGAEHARAVHGLARVAVIDFDVHHGNGTQHSFERDPGLFYASSHQSPCYPGTGGEGEHGVGNVVNAELAPGAGSDAFRRAYEVRILPALAAFAPELVIFSAGFDAHVRDPLAQLRLGTDDFAWVTNAALDVADVSAEGRCVASLEGGYDLDALAEGVTVHVRALAER